MVQWESSCIILPTAPRVGSLNLGLPLSFFCQFGSVSQLSNLRKSPWAHVKCIYCKINKQKGYSFTLLAKMTLLEHLTTRLLSTIWMGSPMYIISIKSFSIKLKGGKFEQFFWIKLNADKSDRITLVKMSELKIWQFNFLHTCVRESQWASWNIGRKGPH